MTREPGDKLAPKLVSVISKTIIATKKGLFWHDKEVRRTATQEIIDALGKGVADLYRPLVDEILAQDPGTLNEKVRAVLESAKSGEHQEQAIAGLLLGGVSGALGTLLSNELAPLVYPIVGRNPFIEIPPPESAAAAARGILGYGTGENLAARQGYDGNAFAAMYQLAQLPPDLNSLLEMRNRNQIDDGTVHFWLKRAGYHDNIINPLMHLAKQLLSPADLALATLRGNIDKGDAYRIAGQQGVDNNDFDVLVGNTGEPPGVSDMLAMYRRGIISEDRLKHGILESRVRNEWIPFVEAMRFQPMTTADAIDAAVQNHIDNDTAHSIAEQNGLKPEHFTPLLQTAGSPLSKTEMLRLHRMGKVTTEEVKQALRESRLKDKYIDHALELTTQLPPLFTIREMLTAGAISDAQAHELLKEDGYQDFVIEAVIKSSHKTKTSKTRDLTEGMIAELYREHIINATEFHNKLVHLGYSDEEADEIKELNDQLIVKSDRDNSITHIRALFEGYKLDETEAQHRLNALLVPAATVEHLLNDWKLSRVQPVRHLTTAQIVSAWKINLFDDPTAIQRLEQTGYSAQDARLILEIANKGPLRGKAITGGSGSGG